MLNTTDIGELVAKIAQSTGILPSNAIGAIYPDTLIQDATIEIRDGDGKITCFSLGRGGADGSVAFVRVGDRLFLDDRLNAHVPQNLEASVVYLQEFNSFLAKPLYTMHSSLALAAMSYVDFNGLTVLDLGSGDGALSLEAIKRGAAGVIAVDKNDNYLNEISNEILFYGHLKANKMDGPTHRFVQADIDLSNRYWELFQPEERKKVNAAIANLGPTYGLADIAAIFSLLYFKNIDTFIGAGYHYNGNLNIGHVVPRLRPLNPSVGDSTSSGITTYWILKELGFKITAELFEVAKMPGMEEYGRMAFVARR